MAPRDQAALTLAAHFFPPGLLPLDDLVSFHVSGDNVITAQLSRSGSRRIHNKSVLYAKTISGKLELGKLSQLKGIAVRELLLLPIPVTSIQCGGPGTQQMGLRVGPRHEHIPLSAF